MSSGCGSRRSSRRKTYSRWFFCEWLAGQGTSDPLLSQIGVKEVVAFYDREAAKVSAATLRRRLCALRKFFSWAESEGYARAILSLLYFTGIRVSELCALNTNSIGERLLYGKPGLRVAKGKGGKERKVPVAGPAFREVRNWEEKRHLANPVSSALFLTGIPHMTTILNPMDRPQREDSPGSWYRTFYLHLGKRTV